MNKKIIFSAMLVSMLVFFAFFVLACSGKSLNGTWVSDRYQENWIEFSGKRFSYGSYLFGNGLTWLNRDQREATDGTYSISNDKIEMIFSDGRIEVYLFSRTENILEYLY